MSDVHHSKTAPEKNQCSVVKFMSDMPNFWVAVGVAVSVVLTAGYE